MKAYLCRRKRTNLIIHTTSYGDLSTTTGRADLNLGVTDLTAFESTQFGDAAENWNLLSKLKNSEWMSSKGQITVMLVQETRRQWNEWNKSPAPLTLRLEGPLLDSLSKSLRRFNVKMALQVFLDNGPDANVGSIPDCNFTEMSVCTTDGEGRPQGAFCKQSGQMSENLRYEFFRRGDRLVNVEVSLIISAEKKTMSPAGGKEEELSCVNVNKKLLMEEVRTDLEIIAENGKGVKCLSAFLVVHSEVIKAMLESDMRETHDNRILMEDVSEEGVKALLAYLYYRDLEMPLMSSVLAVELLELSHRYLIGGLENAVKGILLEKDVKWFEGKAAMRLFYFAGKLDNHKDLRRKAVEVLQSKPNEVMACEEYQRLFQVGKEGEDDGMEGVSARLKGVKELCDALLSATPPPVVAGQQGWVEMATSPLRPRDFNDWKQKMTASFGGMEDVL